MVRRQVVVAARAAGGHHRVPGDDGDCLDAVPGTWRRGGGGGAGADRRAGAQAAEALGLGISLNTVCVYCPALFGVISTLFTAGLGNEVGGANVAVASALIMAVLPAHLMRSVAGGYDNESMAIAAITGTFYLWLRALRTESSWPIAALAGLMYFYMAALWGGYTFVINMVGVHVALIVWFNKFDCPASVYKAYSLFFVVGTLGALQVPIVGWAPLQSMEQLGPMAVFLGIQALRAISAYAAGKNLKDYERDALRQKIVIYSIGGGVLITSMLLSSGYLWSMSVRIKALFVKHTRTGNPLVDSVAEHQATSPGAYWSYLQMAMFWGMFGAAKLMFNPLPGRPKQVLFFAAYLFISLYFSTKMVRLVLLSAPAVAVGAGAGYATLLAWCHAAVFGSDAPEETKSKKAGKKVQRKAPGLRGEFDAMYDEMGLNDAATRRPIAMGIFSLLMYQTYSFGQHCVVLATHVSEPQVLLRVRNPDPTAENPMLIVRDYVDSYEWLRDNTPEDSRVMSWWDYGYQINGIANRTTIADGNTWNHEHIALLGRCLVLPEAKSHPVIKHLADYVLVWSTRHYGLRGDDLAKMPHMARIAGSVFKDVDPAGYMAGENDIPPKMRESTLYQLHSWNIDHSIPDPEFFEHVFTSEHRMVRIFKVKGVDQKSKQHPIGSYPPAVEKIVQKGKAFKGGV